MFISSVNKESWPAKVGRESYTNSRDQYTQLTQEVFEQEFSGGKSWYKLRYQQARKEVHLSGDKWCLDTLEGVEMGLLHPGLRREFMASLNVSRNSLIDIDCLNARADGQYEFRGLAVLNASRNQLTDVRLELENLAQVNLAHNQLRFLPNLECLVNLQKLHLSHNQIDGPLQHAEGGGRGLQRLARLFYLDLSHNCFSWKPSLFAKQLEALVPLTSLTDLRLYPNPFVEHFKEYQFITVATLDGLSTLDGFELDELARSEIRKKVDELGGRFDFTIYDVMVNDRVLERAPMAKPSSGESTAGVLVPRLTELIRLLEKAMDMPNQVTAHVQQLEDRVATMWNSHIWDRQRLMPATGPGATRLCYGCFRGSCSSPACPSPPGNLEDWQRQVAEFADKMQQALNRFDSVQDVLVMCLVRLLANGNSSLADRCAELLADWVDAAAPDLRSRVTDMADVLFADLRARALRGLQSINEDPTKCKQASEALQRLEKQEERKSWLEANKDRWPADAIAESACIIQALGRFGTSVLHAKPQSPFRSQVLQPFLLALCRDSFEVRGQDGSSEQWEQYLEHDVLPDSDAALLTCEEGEIQVCKQRCIKENYGGFVTEKLEGREGMMLVHFKSDPPHSLVGLRRRVRMEGWRYCLWTRPLQASPWEQIPRELSNTGCDAWPAWRNGLSVLVAATSHRQNAALCVKKLDLHRRVAALESSPIFLPERLFLEDFRGNGPPGPHDLLEEERSFARLAFVSLMQLVQNLARAYDHQGLEAKKYFQEQSLHLRCWKRAKWRLSVNEVVSSDRITKLDDDPKKDKSTAKKDKETKIYISALFSAVCCLGDWNDDAEGMQHIDDTEMLRKQQELSDDLKIVSRCVMRDLKHDGLDLYYMMAEVSAHPMLFEAKAPQGRGLNMASADTTKTGKTPSAGPDPLMFASSLDLIFTFLSSDETRNDVVEKTLQILQYSAVLVPYMKGPKIKDEYNMKYAELWRQSETVYSMDSSIRERMPELFLEGLDERQRQKQATKWLARVPVLAHLSNPLMHRSLINIVRLFDLFSKLSEKDDTGALRMATDVLDRAGREDMLIGPANGLVTCPDYDVKLECLRCIKNVVLKSTQQFETNEMGMLMRYLTAEGMGVGQQEEFLMMVLEVIIKLVTDSSSTGQLFRDRFAKNAVREAFEMLRVNCKRDVAGSEEEEESKLLLSLQICNLLQACSAQRGQALRKFLRRIDLLAVLMDVIKTEDKSDAFGCRGKLLRTWTGREVQDLLLPLVTHDHLDKWRIGRYRALVRMADVLAGKKDYSSTAKEVMSSNENDPWPSISSMRKQRLAGLPPDPTEDEDWRKQQEQFMNSGGLWKIIGYGEAYCERVEYIARFQAACEEVDDIIAHADDLTRKWWERPQAVEAEAGAKRTKKAMEKTPLEKQIIRRLLAKNEQVMSLFNRNLNLVDSQGEVLLELARVFARELEGNKERAKMLESSDYNGFKKLQEWPDKVRVPPGSGKLQNVDVLKKVPKIRQHIDQIGQETISQNEQVEKLVDTASSAQIALKKQMVTTAGSQSDKETEKWANTERGASVLNTVDPKVKTGLVGFLRNNHAEVIDVVVEPPESIVRKFYKYKPRDASEVVDRSRLRGLARLVIEYPSAKDLLASLQDMEQGSVHVQKVRNRFKKPNSLGQRFIVVFVEVALERNTKHLAELKLVLADNSTPKVDSESRSEALKKSLEDILHNRVKVAKEDMRAVADFLIYVLQSRSVRHRDNVRLLSQRENKFIEVSGGDVFAETDDPTHDSVLVIERRDGEGPIASGDVVYIKSKSTHMYLDIGGNGQAHCRTVHPEGHEHGHTKFIVELVAPNQSTASSWIGGPVDALAEDAIAEDTGPGETSERTIHENCSLRFKVRNTKRYLTVGHVKSLRGGAGRCNIKGQVLSGEYKDPDEFKLMLEGSLQQHVALDGADVGPRKSKPTEAQKDRFLAEAHLCAEPPRMDGGLAEGGEFRKAPPEWKTIAWRQAEGKSGFGGTGKDFCGDDRAEEGRLGLILAAIFRCAYALVEFPREGDARERTVTEVQVGFSEDGPSRESMRRTPTARLLALAFAEQKFQPEAPEPDVVSAWLSAKLLRFYSAVLSRMPALCEISDIQDGQLDGAEEEALRHERGIYDRQRLMLLLLLAEYVSRVIRAPLTSRLSMVTSRDLDECEIVLLYEFANIMNNIVQSFLENELRASPAHHGPRDSRAAQGRLALRGAPGGRASLSEEARLDIFSALVPESTLKLLVHTLLFGMHQEAVFFQNQMRQPERRDMHFAYPRRISSLVERCIAAIAGVLSCSSGENRAAQRQDDADYHVCSAISHAMSAGSQVVPRARVAQLMHERVLDGLRSQVQQKIRDGEIASMMAAGAEEADSEPPRRSCPERVSVIAVAWVGALRGQDSRSPEEAARRLVVVTSRLNFAAVALPPLYGGSRRPPVAESLRVVACRDLRSLRQVEVWEQMRQCLVLHWEHSPGSPEAPQREVLLFESAGRRRAFQGQLQKLPRPKAAQRQRHIGFSTRLGVPMLRVREEVIHAFIDGRRPCNNLVDVFFIEDSFFDAASQAYLASQESVSFADSFAEPAVGAEPKLLVLTLDSVVTVSLNSFLRVLSEVDSRGADGLTGAASASKDREGLLEDTDSEDDELPKPVEVQHSTEGPRVQTLHDPLQLKQLDGVWFLAEAAPKVRLQAGSKALIAHFLSDGERQRFRRHLAHTLLDDGDASEQAETAKGWSVLPTAKTDLKEVKKAAEGHARQGDHRRT